MAYSRFIPSEDEAIVVGMRAYSRDAKADFSRNGVTWDIIPRRRWAGYQDETGAWLVSGYQTACDMRFETPLITFRITRWKIARLQ